MPQNFKRLGVAVSMVTLPIANALASQGPGVSDGTASPELQRGVVLAFCTFFAVIFLAYIGRRK